MSDGQPKSWWGRNWFWVVPLGCLAPIVAVVGCVVVAFFAVTHLIKSSDVYTHSLAAVSSSEAVRTALGEPIQAGFQFAGNINVSNQGGHGDVTYNISGPKDSATVHAVADKHDGEWSFTTNHVHINSTNQELDVPVAN
jgi:hypothetical protein